MTIVFDGSTNDSTDDGGSDNSVAYRVVFTSNLTAASGNQVTVSFRTGTATGSATPCISGAWIGRGAGSGSRNFTGNQVQLKFSGSNTFNCTATPTTFTSDVATLGESFSNAVDYIVSFRIDTAATGAHLTISGATFTGVQTWFLTGSTAGEESNTTATAGYTSDGVSVLQFVRQITITAAAGDVLHAQQWL